MINIDQKVVDVWNLVTGAKLSTLEDASLNNHWQTDISANNHLVSHVIHNSTIQIWDVTNGAVVATLTEHRGDVLGTRWSPDGTMLASADRDGKFLVWAIP
jgi:WD40 repeat protein